MPDCPYCETAITEDVEMESWESYDQQVNLYYIGKCPCCGRSFKWTEYYMYSDYDELEELE